MKAKRTFLAVLSLACAMALCLALTACGSKIEATEEVNLTVDATAAVEAGWDGDATLFQGAVAISQDGTVLDALNASGLTYNDKSGYIDTINGLAGLQYGESSGWTYTVNGDFPMDSADQHSLSAGDTVVFTYVTEYIAM